MTPAELRKPIEAALLDALGPRGFRLERGILLRERCPVATDWIALLLTGRRSDKRVDAMLNVGIRCGPLHSLLAELSGAKPDRTVATFVLNLGYLASPPRACEWRFERGEFDPALARSMRSDLETLGLPFLERCADFASLREKCSRHGLADHNRLRLPALDFLAGDLEGARKGLEQQLEELRARTDAAALDFRTSSGRLLERIRAQG